MRTLLLQTNCFQYFNKMHPGVYVPTFKAKLKTLLEVLELNTMLLKICDGEIEDADLPNRSVQLPAARTAASVRGGALAD
jgi:hypothetical protein